MDRSHGVVIPTALADPAQLLRVVHSALTQDLAPVEVLVVASEDPPTPLPDSARTVSVDRLGTARQRNAGLAASTADVVHFIDDDIVLGPDYLRHIDHAFDDPGVVGATGNLGSRPGARILRRRIRALLAGRTRPGHVSRTGSAEPIDPTADDHDVTWMPGAVLAIRRSASHGLAFDEVLERGPTGPYALAEDLDLSHRLAKRGRLRFVAAAQATHLGAESWRLGWPPYWEMRTLVRRYLAGKPDLGLSPAWARFYLAVDLALATTLVVTGRGRVGCLTAAVRGAVGTPLDRRPER